MKNFNFTLSIKTLFVALAVVFCLILSFQFYLLKNAEKRLNRSIYNFYIRIKNKKFEKLSNLNELSEEEKRVLMSTGVFYRPGVMYVHDKHGVFKVTLNDTLVFRMGKNIVFLNVIFDLILIWIALFFYFKIFSAISRADATISLSTQRKFLPEKLPEIDVEGVDSIINKFQTIYLDYLKTEKAMERKTQFETLGLFSSRIIHDLKNTFSILNVLLYRAKNSKNDKEKNEVLGFIEAKIDSLRFALEEILYCLKEGKDLQFEDVDMEVLKNGFEKEYSIISESKGIEFSVYFDGKLYGKSIKVNPLQFKNAIDNLLNNAVRILEKKKDNRKMGLEFRLNGENLQIGVWDNGNEMGFNSEEIFDPFVSGDNQGTGLGLSSVKEYIKQHDGDIQVKTENGITCFYIIFPMKKRSER